MTDILGPLFADFNSFLLVFARVMAFFVTAPFYSGVQIPIRVKAGFALFLAILLVTAVPHAAVPLLGWAFALKLLGELALGLALGLIGAFLMAGIDFAGEMIGLQIGFGIANVIDPMSEVQISLISQFKFIVFTLILLALGGHQWFLKELADSFAVLPAGTVPFEPRIGLHLFDLGIQVFLIGIKISAPVVVVLLLTSGAMGIIARTMPQMNIFLVGFPVRIAVGLVFLIFSLSFFALMSEGIITDVVLEMRTCLRALAGGTSI